MARFEAVPLTSGADHFFGYYDIQPFNGAQTHILALRPPFIDREPTAADIAAIGLVEVATGRWEMVAETRAWNFQQGCFLHWHPQAPDEKILFNDRLGDQFVCVELNLKSGARRILPRPIAGIDKAGTVATSLNFARLATTRPGYGYEGVVDPFADQQRPDDDGLYVMDLETGATKLIVSVARIAELARDIPGVWQGKNWFNHTVISDDGRRTIFLHRFPPADGKGWRTGCYTVDLADGGNLRKLFGYGLVSHFDWLRSEAVLAWAGWGEPARNQFWLKPDGEGEPTLIAEREWTRDGHCCYSSDYRWILNDTYPMGETKAQRLMLHNPATGEHVTLGEFPHRGPREPNALRCDLHPRFSRDDKLVCFDSTHSGRRQIYVVDVAEVTGR